MNTTFHVRHFRIAAAVLAIGFGWFNEASRAEGPADTAAQPAGKATPPAGRTVRLFILSGQSNAGGKGVGSDLPADLKQTDPEVLRFGRAAKGELTPIAPYHRSGFGTEDSAFGVELIFGKEMKKEFPHDIICVAKQTKGGTSIIAWDKDFKRPGWEDDMKLIDNLAKGPQYGALMQTIQNAIAALKKLPGVEHIEFSGMLWIQSERDDHDPKAAAMYGDNLRKLIANVRADLGKEDMPFLFADANVRRNREVMHAGMVKVATEVPHTAIVSIDNLGRDGVHYNSEGQLELGRRFVAAYLKLIHPAPATAPVESPK